MFKKIIGLWMVLEVALPLFAFYSFSVGGEGNTYSSVSATASSISVIFQRFPRVEFSGIGNPELSLVLGLATWWMGALSIPIFLIPIIRTLRTGGRVAVLRVGSNQPKRSRTSRERLKHSALFIALMRLPNFRYSRTARMRSSYEYTDYLQVVQDFVRPP